MATALQSYGLYDTSPALSILTVRELQMMTHIESVLDNRTCDNCRSQYGKEVPVKIEVPNVS